MWNSFTAILCSSSVSSWPKSRLNERRVKGKGGKMTDSEAKQSSESQTVQENDKQLKYLELVQVAAIYILVCISSVYEYAKENSGPLKPGVQTVEGTVKTVTGPVYEKFRDVPFGLLKFVDRKVEESLSELDRHVPSLLKKVSTQAVIVARSLGSEVQRGSLVDTAKSVRENVYNKYEPVAEQYAVTAWRLLNRLPLFPQVAQIVVPTASHWSDKYNRTIRSTAEKGYAVASYLPFIPLERIAKVFEEAESGHPVSSNGEQVAVAH